MADRGPSDLPDNLIRLRAAAAILATGAIRCAASRKDRGDAGSVDGEIGTMTGEDATPDERQAAA